MNRKLLFVLALCAAGISALVLNVKATQARPPLPAGAITAPEVSLGQPGLNYRYVRTYGITGEPYFDTPYYLNRLYGLFMDSSNNLYTVEEYGNRLLKYGPAGNILLKIGKAGVCQALCSPKDVALDGDGNIWVVDDWGIHQFAPNGDLLQDVSESGVPTGFNGLMGVAFDSQGRMYIADSGNHRVLIYGIISNTLAYSDTIGVTGVAGNDDSHFDSPMSLAIDSSDRLYVTDRGNKRVQRCTHSGAWTCTTFTAAGGGGEIYWGFSVWVDHNDNVYISWPNNRQVTKCDSAGNCALFVSTHPLESSDVAVDSAGNVFVSFENDFTIRKYSSSGAQLGVFAGVSGVPYTTDDEHLNSPEGIVIDSHDDIAVVAGNQLIKMDTDGNRFWAWGVPGVGGDGSPSPGEGLLFMPQDVDVDSNGHYYVADLLQITIIRGSGTFSASLGHGCCGGPYGFWFNRGVAVDPESGKIYATSSNYHLVHVYDSSLNYLTTMGEEGVAGSDNAHFSNPDNVYIDQAGNIYVADTGNCRVQKFNRQRVYQQTFGITGQCGESFDKLQSVDDVAVDSQGKVFIAYWNRVQVYDQAGNYLTTISGGFSGRLSIDLDSAGNVYVADSGNHRIQVFAPGVPGWRQVNINAFGERTNDSIRSLAAFGEQLYAGTSNYGGRGAQLWRKSEGGPWTAMITNGFGYAQNVEIGHLVEFSGNLYASTYNWDDAINNTRGGEIWRSSSGLGWTRVVSQGFGDPGVNGEIFRFAVLSNTLYAGTQSFTTTRGAQIWQTFDGLSWTNSITNGFGNAHNLGIDSFEVFNGYLYAGTGNSTGGELWRSDGTSWNSVNTNGFGNVNNTDIASLSEFNGYLYAGTRNPSQGGELWRSSNGLDWTPVFTGGLGNAANGRLYGLIAFDNRLYLVFSNLTTGAEVWQSADGSTWKRIAEPGWGDSDNQFADYFDRGAAVFNNSLYIGTANSANGGEVWQYVGFQVYLPLVMR